MHPSALAALIINIHSTTGEITFSQRTESKKPESRNCEETKYCYCCNLIAVNAAPSCTVPAAVKVIER